ncbi:uncharacterized protein LOC135480887 [Liolophura sinensis]|uniref:uncharacterized protein LOC135480887 n=1 Tax=Liolophura sinensis TaxID=3198878 RepID=UPI003158A0E1
MADPPQCFSVDREHSSDFNEQAALDEAINIPPPSYQQALSICDHGGSERPRSPSFLSPPQVYTRTPGYVSLDSAHHIAPVSPSSPREFTGRDSNHVPTIVVQAEPSYYCQTLPSYQPRVDPNSPPPDYNSLFGRVKPYRRNGSEGPDIFQTCSKVACSGTIGKVLCTFMVVLLVGILVFMIVIGSVYRFDCPAQNSLPLYLIVSGAVPLVWAVRCFSYQPCLCVDPHEDERRRLARQRKFEGMAIVDAGIFCFIFAWFVIGSYWVYGMWSWSSDAESANYCHPMVYYLVFWSITTIYIIGGCVGGIVIIVVLGIYCCHFWTEYIKPGFCDTSHNHVTEL